jgi:hypothetical protein
MPRNMLGPRKRRLTHWTFVVSSHIVELVVGGGGGGETWSWWMMILGERARSRGIEMDQVLKEKSRCNNTKPMTITPFFR